MKASILTIGDEILIGQIVDTNSASIARHLNNAGIVVWERTSVGDQREQITEAVKRAMNQSDVVILTGGLGPTKDDITKKTLAELFGSRLVCDQTVADHVRRMLEARGIEYNRLNRDQALVPACCTVLFNAHGTAPGMWFEQNGKVVVSLPGVPFEMEHLMTDEVMPRLKARFSLRQIVHRTLITSAGGYLGGAFYQLYRALHRASGGKEGYFGLDATAYQSGAVDAQMRADYITYASSLTALAEKDGAFAPMEDEALAALYPGLMQSVTQVLHSTEEKTNSLLGRK